MRICGQRHDSQKKKLLIIPLITHSHYVIWLCEKFVLQIASDIWRIQGLNWELNSCLNDLKLSINV